jgi:Putative adhesin/Domain of unknown function (DUF5668)
VSSPQQPAPPQPNAQLPGAPLPATLPPGTTRPPGHQRRSVFSGLLLILLGALFLLFHFEPQLRLATLIWRFWPVVIIVWGIAKLVDHLAARYTGEPTMVLTGGEAALLILVIFCLAGLGFADWLRRQADFNFNFHPFSEKYAESEALPAQKVSLGAHIVIQTRRGNISVHAGDGNELRVAVNKTASDSSESAADERMAGVKTTIEQTSDGFNIHPANLEDWEGGVEADLDVQVPKKAIITASSDRGDVTVAGVSGSIDASTKNGDIEVHDAGSDVSATLDKGDVRISGVAGNLRVNGRGSEIEVSDVTGDATFDGEFFGPIRVRNVAQTTHYLSQRSDLTLVHMPGRLELGLDGLEVSDVTGLAKLTTHNKDIDVEDVAGPLDIADSHGDIKIRYARPPANEISVNNDSGEVDLTLPGHSSFEISAESRSGEVDSEFEDPSLQLTNNDNMGKLNGRFGSHGPKITIVTTYGTISVHKSS